MYLIWWIFVCGEQIATLIAVYANWSFAAIEGIGWGWAGVVWLYNLVFYFPLDFIKFIIRYALNGRAWDLVIERRIRIYSNIALHSLMFFRRDPQGLIFVDFSTFCRLLLQGKRISVKKNVNWNGHMHRGLSMDYTHLRPRCSRTEIFTQSLIRWQKRQKEELRLQGTLFT